MVTQNSFLSSGCSMNSHLAVFPFMIFTISEGKNWGLQSRRRWMWSGMTSMARIVKPYSCASSERYDFSSASIPSSKTFFRYFVHRTI